MHNQMNIDRPDPPIAFVSYSWANDQHVAWITNLARRLRSNGVDVRLDRWDVRLGHDLYLFMEQYAQVSARVLVVLSDDYGPKAEGRASQVSGVGTETAIISSTIYQDLGSNRVIPIVPDSGTVAGAPIVPIYLEGKNRIDFRDDNEAAYERLLRELHGVPIETAPALGPNPFVGKTTSQATAMIRNDPARWRDVRSNGFIEINLNENSGRYVIGSEDAAFDLKLQHPYGGKAHPDAPKEIRHYSDGIGKIALITQASERAEVFEDFGVLPMSNRTESTKPGDVLVMLNHHGYWGLIIHDDLVFRKGFNGYEPIALMRYVIGTDRTAELTLDDLPQIS